MEIALLTMAGFGLALLAPILYRLVGNALGLLHALLPAAIAWFAVERLSAVATQPQTLIDLEWLPSVNLSFTLFMDGLGALFVLLIAGIGALVFIYAAGYFHRMPKVGMFHAYMLMFMASMLGLVLSGNLLTLYVFWELTTISSFLLIGFEHQQPESRRAAIQALLLTTSGGLALLAALLLLGEAAGTYQIAEILQRGDAIRGHAFYPAILLLTLLAAFTKSAQVPFHFWLPGAMQAPTPVSAYLHSATMVKAGVFLLARFAPALGDTELWTILVTGFGAATMAVGAYLTFFCRDLKMVLAYLTINVLGTLVMLLGIGEELAIKAALTYLTAHALYKAALFLVVGIIDHETGTRDLTGLQGLWRKMPITALAAGFSALSLAGIAPLFGFIAKEGLLEAVLEAPAAGMALTIVTAVSSVFLVAGAGLIGVSPFFGKPSPAVEKSHEPGLLMWAPPVALTVASVAVGLFPQQFAAPLIEGAASAIRQTPVEVELKLWHGPNIPFFTSLGAVVLGALLYSARHTVRSRLPGEHLGERFGPEAFYSGLARRVMDFAAWQAGWVQAGYLRVYVTCVVLGVIALLAAVAPWSRSALSEFAWEPLYFHDLAIAAVVVAGTIMAVHSKSRLNVIVALTLTGFGVAWVFAEFGGPDLAMTQIVIETLATILMLLAFRRLPKFNPLSRPGSRFRDALIAGSLGLLITLLLLMVNQTPRSRELADYYSRMSVPAGHGRNIVNVILVDFRALDTVGEITALSAAVLGGYWLLSSAARRREKTR